MDPKTNKERLLRVIRGLQLIQRTNIPNSTLAKVAAKALTLLLDEFSKFPPDAAPVVPEKAS